MLLSFVVPAYNEEAYLGACLESILDQTRGLEHLTEIIVVNNASTDRTREIALSYISKPWQRVVVIDRVAQGPTLHIRATSSSPATSPIPGWTPQQLVDHMLAKARADMMEWGTEPTPTQEFAAVLNTEFPIDQMMAEAPNASALQDGRPVNEYYALRRMPHGLASANQSGAPIAPSCTCRGALVDGTAIMTPKAPAVALETL